MQSRKRLLIAESELNRAQLAGDVAAMTAGFRSLAERARLFRSIASSAAVLLSGLAAVRSARRAEADVKTSRFQTILKGASLVSTFWLAFRSPRHERTDNQLKP